jgi:2-polyprenyl-6-methoxyphenol hydroxylase-like FAD-dependent oxidoreductase
VSWRGLADRHTAPPALKATIFDHILFYLPDEGLLLTTAMPGLEGADSRRCQFVWVRPASEQELRLLCTDAANRQHGVSIPPPLIRPEVVQELQSCAQATLPPQFAGFVAQTSQPLLAAIFDLESPQIVFGRVVLLGDAAFVARPHVATGVTKAALDAQSLVDALLAETDFDAALQRYAQERQQFGRWLVARGRRIAANLAPSAAGKRLETAMREYGAKGVVDDEIISAEAAARAGSMQPVEGRR